MLCDCLAFAVLAGAGFVAGRRVAGLSVGLDAAAFLVGPLLVLRALRVGAVFSPARVCKDIGVTGLVGLVRFCCG